MAALSPFAEEQDDSKCWHLQTRGFPSREHPTAVWHGFQHSFSCQTVPIWNSKSCKTKRMWDPLAIENGFSYLVFGGDWGVEFMRRYRFILLIRYFTFNW